MNARKRSNGRVSEMMFGVGALARGVAWLLVAVLLTGVVGSHLLHRQRRQRSNTPTLRTGTATLSQRIDWAAVDTELATAVADAGETAHAHAEKQMTEWIGGLAHRIDDNFLPWFFSYWTQKQLGFKGVGYWLNERVRRDQPTMTERIAEEIQEEFAQRVLRPVIAQREIEAMTRDMLIVYFTALRGHLQDIQVRYDIPKPEWEAYLADLAQVAGSSGPDTSPLTLKTVYLSTCASSVAGSALLVGSIRGSVRSIGAKTAAKIGAKTTTVTAAKGGAATGAKCGAKFLGPIVLFGVVIWDVLDHRQDRRVNEPILRENLNDYLASLQDLLLNDAENGMMGVIHQLETSMDTSGDRIAYRE